MVLLGAIILDPCHLTSCVVIAYLDVPSLKAFSVASREYNREVNKWLWQSLSVGPLLNRLNRQMTASIQSFSGLYSALERDSGRAGRIRHLSLRIDDRPSRTVDPTPTNRVQAIFRAPTVNHLPTDLSLPSLLEKILHSVKNLTSLDIDQSFPSSDIPSASHCLVKSNFPFVLTTFKTSIFTQDIAPFLWSQPSIKTFITIHDLMGFTGVPANILPDLQSVTATMAELRFIIPGRPVHTIKVVSPMRSDDIEIFAFRVAVSASSVAITHLHLPVLADVFHVIRSIANSLPSLRSLEIYLDGSVDYFTHTRINQPPDNPCIIIPLIEEHFPNLGTLTLRAKSRKGWSPEWKIDLLNCTRQYPCTALKRVEFKVGTLKQQAKSVVFCRNSEFVLWSAESGDTKDLVDLARRLRYISYFTG